MNGNADAAQAKKAMRAELRARRLSIPAPERMAAAEQVANTLLASNLLPATGYVAGYWAMAGELPLHVLQMRLGEGRVWCLPCIQDDGTLRFAPWRAGDELVTNRFGIPEPAISESSQLLAADMAVVLVPLIAFTRAGDRLGMGGGFYDRTFAFRQQSPAPPLLVGIAHAFQEVPALRVDPWDVRLDAVVSGKALLRFASVESSA